LINGRLLLFFLAEPERLRLRELLATRLPVQPDGSIPLTARAWTVRGRAA
jgi:hypothetical protein